jgi:PAS domain S-box-containing protein
MTTRILLVEDDELNRSMLTRLLSHKKYDVKAAADGEEGWQIFKRSPEKFNIVLVDLRMPKLSGADLIARMNKIAPDLPKIVISGQGDMDDALAAIELDVFFYIKKPIEDISEFYNIIDKALERDRLIRENRRYQAELKNANKKLRSEVQKRTDELLQMKNRVRYFFEMANTIQREKDIQTKLDLTAKAIHDAGMFRRVIVPLEGEKGKITALGKIGVSNQEAELLVKQPSLPEIARSKILLDKFLISQSYFIPEESGVFSTIPSRVLPGTPTRSKRGWRPNDLFIIPMRRLDNRIMGYLSADDPFDHTRPDLETVQILEQFVIHVALSIEQILLEDELEQSEKKYRNLIENVSDTIYSVDVKGRITFINQRGSEMIGYSRDEILGRPFFDFVDKEYREELSNQFQRLILGEPITQDIPIIHQDGSVRIVTAVSHPLVENGEVVGAFGMARDITERHQLEKRIMESEAQYRSLMENANDAILLVDTETTRIVKANQMASTLTGYSHNELIGKSIQDLRRPEDRDLAMDRFGHVLMHGSGYFEDAPIIRKDGTAVRVEISANIVDLGDTKIYQSILRDVTKQRKMEEELIQRVSQLSILSEISDVLQMTLELNEVLSIILTGATAGQGFGFNRAFILFLDEKEKMLTGQVAIGPSNPEEAGRIWRELSQEHRTLRDMLEYYRKAFTRRDVLINEVVRKIKIDVADADNVFAKAVKEKTPINVVDAKNNPAMPQDVLGLLKVDALAIVPMVSQDKVLGLLLVDNMINKDPITKDDVELLRIFANSSAIAIQNARLVESLEEKVQDLRAAYKELKANRDRLVKTERLSAVGEVAASVAHEIRNPLVSIGGFARTVLNRMDQDDPKRQYMKIIVDEVHRLESILQEILNYARPVVPRFIESDLNEVIEQTMGMMSAEVDDESIHMISDLQKELPKVWIDPDQIRQVLHNMFRNAVHAMPNGGKLTVRTRRQDSFATIEIEDTGVGIDAEHIDKLFTAFYTTKSTGSGLGLTICSQIVHNHRGSIGVTSKVGKGTTFVITLPLQRT